MSTIEAYVQAVVGRIAPGVPGRSRIEADLRAHLEERVAAGEPATEAVARMGNPADVARAYLEGVDLALAPAARRLGGYLFDMALGTTLFFALTLIAAVVIQHSPGGELPAGQLPILLSLAGAVFVLGLLYFPVLESVFGQTVGKRVFGTAVSRENGERIGFGQAVLRRIPLLFDFWPVDAVFLFFTRKRQRAFDIVARTVVIETGGARRAWAWTVLVWVPPALLLAVGHRLFHS